MKQLWWWLRLKNDVFAHIHLWQMFLLVVIEIIIHLLIGPHALPYMLLTVIITLLVFQNTQEKTKQQLKYLLITCAFASVLASIISLWLQPYLWTIVFVFAILICFLYFSHLPFFVVAPGVLIIFAYFGTEPYWFYYVLYVDIVVFLICAAGIAHLFYVTPQQNFQASYRKLRYDFHELLTSVLANQFVNTTLYFQQILHLRTLFNEEIIHCVDIPQSVIIETDQLLQEIDATYFYIRTLIQRVHALSHTQTSQLQSLGITYMGKVIVEPADTETAMIVQFHLDQLLLHYEQWFLLEKQLQVRGDLL